MEIRVIDEARLNQRLKTFSKKHAEEVTCAYANLSKALTFWETSSLDCLRRSGLVRRESSGILAVDQSGCTKNPPFPLRLYFFGTEKDDIKICYLLTLGDKRTQAEDNEWSKQKLKLLGFLALHR